MSESSDNYQVLALKWRPQTFSDVVGQEHITRTLQNTIRQNRVGHAYLFVGPRGIGKTTSARIFAKALNCEAGMNPEPCCECRSCREITDARSMDVVELDGASHNGVDDIRELRENVNYRPSRSRFKIYIIDEVHMLSNAAWNALLKTLEEPPSHVKFFFATTEPHKVLPTVVSRCQRFDLRRIPVTAIVERLKEVTSTEGVPVDERALSAVARFADGGMRDALSVMDQIIAFHGGRERESPISESDVIDVFGLVSSRELGALTEGILSYDMSVVMTVIQRLADRGRDLERLFGDLLYYVRNLLMLSVDLSDAAGLVEASDSERDDMRQILASSRSALIPRILEGLVSSEAPLRNALNKRVYLEALLVKLMRTAHSTQIEDLIAQINHLRGTGEAIPLPATPPLPQPSPQAETERPAAAAEAPPETGAAAAAETAEAAGDPLPEPDSEPESGISETSEAPDLEVSEACEAGEQEQAATDPGAVSSAPADLLHALIRESSNDVKLRPLKPYLQELKAVSFEQNCLELAYDDEFPDEHVQTMQQQANWSRIEETLRRIVRDDRVNVLLKRWIDSVSADQRRRPQPVSAEVRKQVESNPFVQRICDLFNGRIVEVRG